MTDPLHHWENIYETKKPDSVSWYQASLRNSLSLIKNTGEPKDAPLIDIGGGASTLADDLLTGGYTNITVLDISRRAMEISRSRLGARGDAVKWINADITSAGLAPDSFAIWHDRAVFHFLVDEPDRRKYCATLSSALRSGGFAILATFGPNGPLKCSGLPTVRYDHGALGQALGPGFRLISHLIEQHTTPSGGVQEFLYCLFRKIG